MKKNPWQVIQDIEADNSRLVKESIVAGEIANSNDEFFEGIKLAMDSLITFGVKKVPIRQGRDGAGLKHKEFLALADQLKTRKLTGNDAREAIQVAMQKATNDQWNDWYRRILIKDLRCGMTEKTVNNVAKKLKRSEYIVPVFTCQLAHGSEDHEAKMVGDKFIEVKLDGVRVITIVYPQGTVVQYSRNGKELVNFEHIKLQLEEVAVDFDEPMVLDGEVMSSSFQDLMKQVHRKSNVEAGDAVLHLFDMLPLKDFQKGKCKIKQSQRSENLQTWFAANSKVLANIQVLEQEKINLSSAEGKNRFREINRAAIDGGFEGIMIKDIDAPYECKRSTSWLKLKPCIEVDLEVVNVEVGTGKNQGRLGALVCEGVDNGKKISVNVGSGYSDADRDSFWSSRKSLIGQIVEVRADAVTRNQDGSYSLRFPRFRRFRGFKKGEKI